MLNTVDRACRSRAIDEAEDSRRSQSGNPVCADARRMDSIVRSKQQRLIARQAVERLRQGRLAGADFGPRRVEQMIGYAIHAGLQPTRLAAMFDDHTGFASLTRSCSRCTGARGAMRSR